MKKVMFLALVVGVGGSLLVAQESNSWQAFMEQQLDKAVKEGILTQEEANQKIARIKLEQWEKETKQAYYNSLLDEAVSSGKITEAQRLELLNQTVGWRNGENHVQGSGKGLRSSWLGKGYYW